MKFRISVALVLGVVLGGGLWALSNVELEFTTAQVATTFVDFERQTSARAAIKSGLERYGGTLDIAVSDFTDVPLQFVLIRLSNERPIRLLMGRGGVDPKQETTMCEQLSALFEVRFAEELGHRFAIVDGHSIVLSSMDWTFEALNAEAQAVTEIEGEKIARAYQEQFNSLWSTARSSCANRIQFP